MEMVMEFVATKEDGIVTRYVDQKRWQWLGAFALPVIPMSAFVFYFMSGANALYLCLPLVFFFILVPLLDALVGGDANNPPEEVVPAMSGDSHYENVVYLIMPVYFALFFMTVWMVGTQNLPIWAVIALALGIGSINGNMITIAHELGHKIDRKNQLLSRVALSLSGYGHFVLEHNHGHHINVATPEDCASARFNESVYAFALRELPGAFVGGWRIAAKRMRAKGLPVFHWLNEILQVYLATTLITIGLVAWLGWAVLPFILAHHFISCYSLTEVNYIEHYGLLRNKRPNGKYEPCEARHSWNTNHTVSNLLSFHLQRHSDHHAHPMRPYQALRDYQDVPTLSSGYPGTILLAMFPPLWFKVMNPKVMAWAGGDIDKVNTGPAKD